jgi:nuclear GTP-binding protein
LIDCPGVVPPNERDTPEDILLRGVVRVENVEYPAQYVDALLAKCEKRHVERTYDLKGWDDAEHFLDLLARKTGKLLKGGEADVDTVAKSVVNDFLRGRLPWFVPPPQKEGGEDKDGEEEQGIEGRKGRLGEMGGGVKRKRDEESKTDSAVETAVIAENDDYGSDEEDDDNEDDGSVSDEDEDENSDDEFAGFDEDGGGDASGVVLPSSIGNLDAFAEESEVEDEDDEASNSGAGLEDDEEDEAGEADASLAKAEVDDDTHDRKRRREA